MIFLQTMGLIIGLGVIVTLLAALKFAPALTAILGDRIFWPNSGERFKKYADGVIEKNRHKGGYFARSGHFAVKHSKVVILIAIVLTIPSLYVYATTTQTYNFLGSASSSLESTSAYNSLTDAFGSGRMLPSYVVLTFSEPLIYSNGSFNHAELSVISEISSYLAYHEGIQEVAGPTMPYGKSVDYLTVTNASDPLNYSGILMAIGADNQSALITVKFNGDPYSTQVMDYAEDIRSTLHVNYDDTTYVTGVYVGGTTGSMLDVRESFSVEFNQILPIVSICVALVLFFVLGSLLLPIFALASVFMSIFWTLAVTILVFQSAFSYGLLFMTPLILLVLLLGLGMDYNIFILTRVREEAAKGQPLKDAIVNAIEQTGGIITAAAIILAGSLGALMLSSNIMLKEMGFAFAFSILIDALVVRTYLVPAVMAEFGKWNWYNPIKRLQRVKTDPADANTKADTAKPEESQKKQKDQ
jgi:RND superfamily putative drug exporter